VVGGGVGVGGAVRLVGVEGGRGCVCREERWRARDHDGIIRRRPRTLRSRAARGARGKMVAVNPIHFVMALGAGGNGGRGWVGARVQAQRTGRSRRSVAAPRETAGRASGVVRPVRQSNRVGEAEAVALHGGHPGGSGKSPSTKGFPHGPVLRGRQSKDILFWCGSSSGCRLQRRRCRVQGTGCRVDVGCRVRGACGVRAVRAGRPPSETRRRVCHLSSGDQHRSSKKGILSRQGRARLWQWGAVRGRCGG